MDAPRKLPGIAPNDSNDLSFVGGRAAPRATAESGIGKGVGFGVDTKPDIFSSIGDYVPRGGLLVGLAARFLGSGTDFTHY